MAHKQGIPPMFRVNAQHEVPVDDVGETEGIAGTVQIHPDQFDEDGYPSNWIAELIVPDGVPMDEVAVSGKTGWEALANLAQKFSNMGFME